MERALICFMLTDCKELVLEETQSSKVLRVKECVRQ